MVTVRIRSLLWFSAGLALALGMLWTSSLWRAEALPSADESTIVNVTPKRILDSRDPVDVGLAGPFQSQVAQKLQVTGPITTTTSGGGTETVVPPGATGVLLNVTAVAPTADGFVSIRPGDAGGAPSTSSLNVTAGQTVPNGVQVALPTSGASAGKIDITYDALGLVGPTTDLLIDVVGYTTSAGLQDLVSQLGAKANSSDVYTRAQLDATSANVVTRMGTVSANGFPATGAASFGTFTSSKTGTGKYEVVMPGLNPGCQKTPLIHADEHTSFPGFGNWTFAICTVGTGDTQVGFRTADVAGTLEDRIFSFVVFQNHPIVPPPARQLDDDQECIATPESPEFDCS